MKKLSILLGLAILLASCRSGLVMIDKGEYIRKEKLLDEPIVVINPDVKSVKVTSEVYRKYYTEARLRESVVFKSAAQMAARHGMQLNVVGPDKLDAMDYGDLRMLVNLKRNIIEANFSQNNSLNEGVMGYYSGSSIRENVFVVSPRIFPDYSALIERYGTPYFAIMGLVEVDASKRQYGVEMDIDLGYDKNMLMYLAIANIETGELVYREIKQAPHLARRKNLDPLYYDTFSLIKKSLKK